MDSGPAWQGWETSSASTKADPRERRQSSLSRHAASEPGPAHGDPIRGDTGVLRLQHTPQRAPPSRQSPRQALASLTPEASASQTRETPLAICSPTLCQHSLPEASAPAFVQEASLSSRWESGGAQTLLLPAPHNDHAPPRQNSVHNSGGDNDDLLGGYPVPGTGNTPPATALGSSHEPTFLMRKLRYREVRCPVCAAPKGRARSSGLRGVSVSLCSRHSPPLQAQSWEGQAEGPCLPQQQAAARSPVSGGV